MSKNKFTVVIPVHKLNKELGSYLSIAINSVAVQEEKPQEVVIVAKDNKTLLNDLNLIIEQFKETGLVFKIVANKGKTDYQSQVNLGVENVSTEWFTILNLDDKFSPRWFSQFNTYLEAYPNVDVFLPVVQETTTQDIFSGFRNEPVWAGGFTEEVSILNHDTLLDVNMFTFDGGFFKTEDFKTVGGLKSNIVYSFEYEFLLRATAKPLRIMVIPKIGYIRVNGREDSLTANYEKTLSITEKKFWNATAKKEYFFNTDREINTSFLNDSSDSE